MREQGFGRLVSPPDARDLDYSMRGLTMAAVAKPRKSQYREGPMQDQGPTPHCVGYSTRGVLQAAPLMVKPAVGPSATALYKSAQVLDEWPGTNYDGSSVRGGMKALQAAGYISTYVWADVRNPQQAINTLREFMNGGLGTVVVGSNWYLSMDNVDSKGFIVPPSARAMPVGGHAYRLNWWDAKRQGFLVINSWGRFWGHQNKGVAWMSEALLLRLLFEEGEAAAPSEIKAAYTVNP